MMSLALSPPRGQSVHVKPCVMVPCLDYKGLSGQMVMDRFFLRPVVCVASDDTGLNMICSWLNQYSKEMCIGLNFSSITSGAEVCARACAWVCLGVLRGGSVCTRGPRNKGQGHCVCLQYAFEMRSLTENAWLSSGFSWSPETRDHRNLFPISDDRLDDCGYLAPPLSKL